MSISPAFRPWAWCLLWLSLLWALFFVLANTLSNIEGGFYNNKPLASEQLALHPNDPLVIAMGDSLLRNSIPAEQWLEKDVRWLRLAGNNAHISSFARYMQQIEELQPKLILVQDTLLLARTENMKVKLRDPIQTIFHHAYCLVAPFVSRLNQKRCDPNYINWNIPTVALDGTEEPIQNKIGLYQNSLSSLDESREFLTQLQTIADKVVVINLPRSREYNAFVDSGPWLAHLKQLLNEQNIEFIEVGSPLPANLYIDGAHVSQEGRMQRLQLLKPIINSHL